MTIITHSNMRPYLDRISESPEFQIRSTYKPTGDEWYRQKVTLEFPLGEAAKDWLTSMALGVLPGRNYTIRPITGKEGFAAQGMEGKVGVEKELFAALMNLRDLLPEHRGRILLNGK